MSVNAFGVELNILSCRLFVEATHFASYENEDVFVLAAEVGDESLILTHRLVLGTQINLEW